MYNFTKHTSQLLELHLSFAVDPVVGSSSDLGKDGVSTKKQKRKEKKKEEEEDDLGKDGQLVNLLHSVETRWGKAAIPFDHFKVQKRSTF